MGTKVVPRCSRVLVGVISFGARPRCYELGFFDQLTADYASVDLPKLLEFKLASPENGSDNFLLQIAQRSHIGFVPTSLKLTNVSESGKQRLMRAFFWMGSRIITSHLPRDKNLPRVLLSCGSTELPPGAVQRSTRPRMFVSPAVPRASGNGRRLHRVHLPAG